jgi:hypothetical protein
VGLLAYSPMAFGCYLEILTGEQHPDAINLFPQYTRHNNGTQCTEAKQNYIKEVARKWIKLNRLSLAFIRQRTFDQYNYWGNNNGTTERKYKHHSSIIVR